MVEGLFSARIENWKVGNSEEAERGEVVIKLQMNYCQLLIPVLRASLCDLGLDIHLGTTSVIIPKQSPGLLILHRNVSGPMSRVVAAETFGAVP